MPKLVIFLGSGFSAELGYPTTGQLQEKLLDSLGYADDVIRREEFISERIREFWRDVFGWKDGQSPPALEDHFTQIDMAANSGHNLGQKYDPRKLRAIRRMTIHRVFKLLDIRLNAPEPARELLQRLASTHELTVITTNWDIAVEKLLQEGHQGFNYGIGAVNSAGQRLEEKGIPVFKLHGSGNWGYCDCCRNLVTFELDLGKAAVHLHLLLEPEDFRRFNGGDAIADDLEPELRRCMVCGGRWGARVATFSFRKDLSVAIFQTIWDEARFYLQRADRWLFIGYSMPAADIEIRHLLKSAQLARRTPSDLSLEVVLKGDQSASHRYQSFFGLPDSRVFQNGLSQWIAQRLDLYCE